MKREAWFRHPRLNDVVAEMWGGSGGGSQNFFVAIYLGLRGLKTWKSGINLVS